MQQVLNNARPAAAITACSAAVQLLRQALWPVLDTNPDGKLRDRRSSVWLQSAPNWSEYSLIQALKVDT